MTTLTAISPLDGRYADKMSALRPIFSEYGLIKYRVQIEVRWLIHLATHAQLPELPPFSPKALAVLNDIILHFSEQDAERVKAIEAGINHDVKAVEYFLKERIQDNAELAKVSEFIHFGCTSEDINNLAHALMLQAGRQDCLIPSLQDLIHHLSTLAHDHASLTMLARTHGQAATPTTLGKEMANVVARLQRQVTQLCTSPLLGKTNGATGNYNAHHVTHGNADWQALSESFVKQLGLDWNAYTTQIEPHDYIAELFMTIMRINTILIDLNRDIWSYIAIQYLTQKPLKNEVGSSTMPHKINPIDFENAEGNLGLANALLDHMANKLPISRWQRDLSDSTVLRNMGLAFGHSLLAYQSTAKGLQKISPNNAVIHADLEQHWEVLAEPIQMVMRRYGIEQPYEKLKAYTRGQAVNKALLHAFISELALPDAVKQELLALTPHNYVGYANDLAKNI